MGEGKRAHDRAATGARFDALIALGLAAQDQGEHEAAESAYREILAVDPTEPRAVQLIGALLVERDQVDEAVDLFEAAAARLGPPTRDSSGFYNNYANTLRRGERLGEAEVMLRQIVEIAPNEWQPWHNLAQTLKDGERLDEAAAAVRRAIVLAPQHGPNHAVLGDILQKLGRLHGTAHAAFQRCLALGSTGDVNVWTALGNNHRFLGELDEAIEALKVPLELMPFSGHAHSNLAIAYIACGRFDESLALFERAIEMVPDDEQVRSNRGYARLTAGLVAPGWDDWEHGAVEGGPRGAERKLGVPRWQPDETDVRVICYREQGVGDEILFASCYPDLIARAREVVIECDPRLQTLFARSFPGADVRAQTWTALAGETATDFDRAIPAGSLPVHFRPTAAAFPERDAFLVADPERVEAWRTRLQELGDGAFVGMSWRSRINTKERRVEYTRLDEWAPLFEIPGVQWVNLQYDDCEHDLRDAERRFGVTIHRWDDLDLMNDFDEIAALTTALDLVVAPRNAVAMLSGALGAPTVMMGNRWDWSDLGTDTSPWFPTIELVYRHLHEDWDQVLATAADFVRAAARVTTRTS